MITTNRASAAAILTGLIAAPAASAQTRDGWALQWQDAFAGPSLDAARWEALNRRDSYNEEKQYYTPNAVSVADGRLKLRATNVPLAGKPYQSGLVRTWAEQTYGRWEVRASLPTGQGMWPAIWLLPRFVDWPRGGEIDVMENRGSQPTVVGNAYHWGNSVATHAYVARDFGYRVGGQPVSFHGSMHDYAVEWDAHRIRYFTDGVPTYTLRRDDAAISSSPMSLILNLAVGGLYGGDPDATTQFPQTFEVDDVRVYRRDAATANLANRSFERTAGDLLGEWEEYSGGANVGVDERDDRGRTGTKALKLFGRFNGQTNLSGVHQEIPATPGQVVQFDAWARNRPDDLLAGGNEGRIKVEFVDADGNVIDAGQLNTTDAASPTAYRQFAVRRVAPAGSVFARAVVEMRQVANAGGAFNVDDVNLRTIDGAVAGDVDLDGTRTAADLDLLLHSLTPDNRPFDFDANGLVNRADVTRLLADAFATTDGDADLNGRVEFADLLTLAANYGRVGDRGWASGDFGGDGGVAFDDLLVLAANYGAGAAALTADDFAADWARATAIVPEPSALAAVAAGALLAARRPRRPTSRAAASR